MWNLKTPTKPFSKDLVFLSLTKEKLNWLEQPKLNPAWSDYSSTWKESQDEPDKPNTSILEPRKGK